MRTRIHTWRVERVPLWKNIPRVIRGLQYVEVDHLINVYVRRPTACFLS